MLRLLELPISLLRFAFYALCALVDALSGRNWLRVERAVQIAAPRDVVWRFVNADRVVFDGPPVTEIVTEPLPEDAELRLVRYSINGNEWCRVVVRQDIHDEAASMLVGQQVPHALTWPREFETDCRSGVKLAPLPNATELALFNEMTIRSFRERITLRLGIDRHIGQIKQQIEKETGTQSQLVTFANHGLLLSLLALLSFWYLLGWQDALLLGVIVVLHELGHAAAMRMVGVEVQGRYLVPFVGGAAVPKSAYPSEGALGFVALMGPGFSLIPTFGLLALVSGSDDELLLKTVSMFAFINGANLLPIYPLDGGLILNALLGSLDRRLALVAGWIGVLIGLGAALALKSWLIGIPFMLFALQRYLSRGRTLELRRLSLAGGMVLVLAFVATFALYVLAFGYAESMLRD
jgi:Zn-dependent protease